jgi:hypothetical protein
MKFARIACYSTYLILVVLSILAILSIVPEMILKITFVIDFIIFITSFAYINSKITEASLKS